MAPSPVLVPSEPDGVRPRSGCLGEKEGSGRSRQVLPVGMNTAGRGARRSGPPASGAPGVQGPRHSGPPVGSGPTEPPAQVTKPRTPKASSTLGCHYLASEKPTLHWGWGERGPQRHRALSEGTAQTSAPRAPPKSWWPAEPPTQSQFKDPPEAESPPTLAGAACSTLCPPRTAPRHCQPPRKSMGSSESRGGGAGGEAAGALSSCFHACCPPQGIRTPPHCLARRAQWSGAQGRSARASRWEPGLMTLAGRGGARGEGRGSWPDAVDSRPEPGPGVGTAAPPVTPVGRQEPATRA